MMTVKDHIQEVLGRDAGWALRGQWPVLESRPARSSAASAHVVAYDPYTNTWGRTRISPGGPAEAPLDPQGAWTVGYFSAAAAADDAEEFVRSVALLASASVEPRAEVRRAVSSMDALLNQQTEFPK